MDRYGVRLIMVVSLTMIAISFVLRPLMSELWHWYAVSLIQYTGYVGASILSAGKLVGLWFQRTRGRVMGITAMGNNFGGLIFPPLLGATLPLVSWEGSYVLLGVISVALAGYTFFAVRDAPDPAGSVEEPGHDKREAIRDLPGWTLGEALHSRAFYAIALAILLGTFTYAAILPQIITHLTDLGVSIRLATSALSVFAVFGIVGKYTMGSFADRIGSRYALMINFAGQAVFLIVMIWAGNPVVLWVSVTFFGFFNGAFGALFQLVVQDAFGVRHYGGIMGMINLTAAVSFGVGPILAGASFDKTGSYTFAFVTVAVMFVIAGLALTQGRTELRPA